MKLSDVMSHAGLALWAEAALLLFFAIFAATALWLLFDRRKQPFDDARAMPLDDLPSLPEGTLTTLENRTAPAVTGGEDRV